MILYFIIKFFPFFVAFDFSVLSYFGKDLLINKEKIMDSLVSFEGAADVLNNLINKISDAVGWGGTHSTPQREAVSTYIQEIQNSNYDPLPQIS